MKLSNLAKPFFAASLLAVLSMGCAAQTREDVADVNARTGSTQQQITGAEGMSIASGTFGIVNGAFTAYVTLDNFIKYGAPSPNDKILGDLKTANDSLKSLQASQAQQFNQLKVDNIILSINDIEDKIDRAYGEYDASTDKASFVPSELEWSDFDMLNNRIASVNGTTDAFTLVKDGMLKKTGGIVDDPLGVYALRMRTRLAQARFLLTVKTPMTADQLERYDAAVKRLETSFSKATRAYFVAKVAPANASGTTSECYQPAFSSYRYDTPGGGYNGGWESFQACTNDRMLWGSGTVRNSRLPVVNTVWSEQDALATGKWKPSAGTVVVKSASMTTDYATTDITNALKLVCNSVENCSIPPGTQFSWLGGNPVDQNEVSYTVQYSCGDDKGDRNITIDARGRAKALVLACNFQKAVAGVYESTAHDASTGRGLDDKLVVETPTPAPLVNPLLGLWTYSTADASLPSYMIYNDPGVFDWFRTSGRGTSGIAGSNVGVEWNEDGHVVRIGRVSASDFGFADASDAYQLVSPAQ